jgi:hypothetical protein
MKILLLPLLLGTVLCGNVFGAATGTVNPVLTITDAPNAVVLSAAAGQSLAADGVVTFTFNTTISGNQAGSQLSWTATASALAPAGALNGDNSTGYTLACANFADAATGAIASADITSTAMNAGGGTSVNMFDVDLTTSTEATGAVACTVVTAALDYSVYQTGTLGATLTATIAP